MRPYLHQLFLFFLHLGGFGLLLLGVLDSSFLFMPLSNDLLMVVLTARKHSHWPLYVAMATAGSVLGCLITDIVSREAGEEGLEKRVPKKRLEYVERKVEKSAAWALALASIMPPPFPFTPFVVVTAALEYPRKKLLSIIAVFRFIRFTAEAILAMIFGRHILALARRPVVSYAILVLIIVSIVGTTYSLYSWAKRSRAAAVPGRAKLKPSER